MSLKHRFTDVTSHLELVTIHSNRLYDEIRGLLHIVTTSETSASKNTHYHELDLWSAPINVYVHKMLNQNGFMNGDPLHNSKIPEVLVWWDIYGIINSIHYSEFMKTDVSLHHSSACSRNEALKFELVRIIELFN